MISKAECKGMRRAVPGDQHCADCGGTAGTKAHRAARTAEAQSAGMPTHYGVVQPVPARRPAVEAPAVEAPAVEAPIPADVHPIDVPAGAECFECGRPAHGATACDQGDNVPALAGDQGDSDNVPAVPATSDERVRAVIKIDQDFAGEQATVMIEMPEDKRTERVLSAAIRSGKYGAGIGRNGSADITYTDLAQTYDAAAAGAHANGDKISAERYAAAARRMRDTSVIVGEIGAIGRAIRTATPERSRVITVAELAATAEALGNRWSAACLRIAADLEMDMTGQPTLFDAPADANAPMISKHRPSRKIATSARFGAATVKRLTAKLPRVSVIIYGPIGASAVAPEKLRDAYSSANGWFASESVTTWATRGDAPAAEAPAPAVESVDQGDTVTAGTVDAEAPAPRPTYNMPAPHAATLYALIDAAEAVGYRPRVTVMPAGSYLVGKSGKYGETDAVSLQIATPANTDNGPHYAHNVIDWDSRSDVVTVRPGATLHTIDQVRAYLAGYGDAVRTARFGSDALERVYRDVTGANPYGNPLPRRTFTVPAPADFTAYADEIEGCGCTLCVALVDSVAGDNVDQGAAGALFVALASRAHTRTVPAVVPAAEAPAPAVESVDQGDAVTAGTVDAEAPAGDASPFAGVVRQIIAGATWSFGTGYIGGGKRRRGTKFHGPIMHPALPDRRLSRDEWTALADQVRALGGGAWMRDVKGFACVSGDVGNPWKAATLSTRERVTAWLAGDQGAAPAVVPAAEAPADVDQAVTPDAGNSSDSGDAEAPAAPARTPRQRDPRKRLAAVLRKIRSHPGTECTVSVIESTGVVLCKGARPTDDQVSEAFGGRYLFADETPGIVGTYYRFTPVKIRPTVPTEAPASSTVLTFASTGEAYDAVNRDDVPDGTILNVPSERVVGFVNDAWPVAVTVDRGEFHAARNLNGPEFDRYRDSIETARALALAGTSIGYALAGEIAERQDSARDVDQAGSSPAAVPAAEAPAPAVDDAMRDAARGALANIAESLGGTVSEDGDAVTVTLVYADDAPAEQLDESPAPADVRVPALAGETHGAHAQRFHVTDLGDLDGYRFHLVAGVGARQFRKAIGSALLAHAEEFGARFAVTTPTGARTVNVAPRPGESVSDWSPVLALVAGIIGTDKIVTSECGTCDRSHALAES